MKMLFSIDVASEVVGKVGGMPNGGIEVLQPPLGDTASGQSEGIAGVRPELCAGVAEAAEGASRSSVDRGLEV